MRKLLATGTTGLVGGAVVSRLLANTDCEIFAIARGRGSVSARHRVLASLQEQWEFDGEPGVFQRAAGRVKVIDGDVSDFVPDAKTAARLQEVDTVLHCAADVNLGKDPFNHVYLNNVNGTRHMLDLAAKLPQLTAFHFVSTAYVAGRQDGPVFEDRLSDAPVNNSYEKSKRQSERLVREFGLPFTVYRPSIVVGRLSDGAIRKPLAFYRILEFFAKLKKHLCAKQGLPPHAAMTMPFRLQAALSSKIFFVPIDYVQRAIATLLSHAATGQTYHLTGRSPVTTSQIAVVTNRLLNVTGLEVMDRVDNATPEERMVQKFMSDLLPYFSSMAHFDVANARRDLGEDSLAWNVGIDGLTTIIGAYFANTFPDLRPVKPDLTAPPVAANA